MVEVVDGHAANLSHPLSQVRETQRAHQHRPGVACQLDISVISTHSLSLRSAFSIILAMSMEKLLPQRLESRRISRLWMASQRTIDHRRRALVVVRPRMVDLYPQQRRNN